MSEPDPLEAKAREAVDEWEVAEDEIMRDGHRSTLERLILAALRSAPPSIPEDYPAKREVDMIAAKQKAHEARMDPMTNPDPKPIEPSEERKRVDAFLAGLDDSDDWTRDLLAFRAQARAEERDAWVEANAGQMEEVRRQERERSLECPECGGNIGCLNGCTGDMAVQLRAALREAKIEGLNEALDLICLETSALDAIHTVLAKLEGER